MAYPDAAWERDVCRAPRFGGEITLRHKLLTTQVIEFGWEAGIRTPITWFRGAIPDVDGDGSGRFC
jgi:hypothetical protein